MFIFIYVERDTIWLCMCMIIFCKYTFYTRTSVCACVRVYVSVFCM